MTKYNLFVLPCKICHQVRLSQLHECACNIRTNHQLWCGHRIGAGIQVLLWPHPTKNYMSQCFREGFPFLFLFWWVGTNRAPRNSPGSTPVSDLYCFIKKLLILRESNIVVKLLCLRNTIFVEIFHVSHLWWIYFEGFTEIVPAMVKNFSHCFINWSQILGISM